MLILKKLVLLKDYVSYDPNSFDYLQTYKKGSMGSVEIVVKNSEMRYIILLKVIMDNSTHKEVLIFDPSNLGELFNYIYS